LHRLAAFDSHTRFDDQVFGNHWSSRSGVSSSPRATAPLPERRSANNIATGAAIKVDPATVQILKLPAMVIQVSTRKPIRSPEWASRSSERILRPFPNHDQSHRGRLGRHGESGPSRPSVVLAWNDTGPRSGRRIDERVRFLQLLFSAASLVPGVRHYSRKRVAKPRSL
jgi:hypothetical protein